MPNLYDFATSELSQDATLAYILSWAKPELKEQAPELNALGENLLRDLVRVAAKARAMDDPLDGRPINDLDVGVQLNRVDIYAEINKSTFLLIEDKTFTNQHSDQISRYEQTIREKKALEPSEKWTILPVYLKTGNDSATHGEDARYGVYLRHNLLKAISASPSVENAIITEFREHLEHMQKKTMAFKTAPVKDWTQNLFAKEGYYIHLREWLKDQGHTENVGWGYVPNAAGGFLGFWWHWQEFVFDGGSCWIYLQIEDATRLKIRAGGVSEGQGETPEVTTPLLREVLEALLDTARDPRFSSIRVKKTPRLSHGKAAAVADVFSNDEKGTYLGADDDSLLDLAAAHRRLQLAMELLDAVSARSLRGGPEGSG